MEQKYIKGVITKWVADNFGQSEAEDPSWSIEALAEHLATELSKNVTTLIRHTTDGGAVYLQDAPRVGDATIVIRLDGGAELLRCSQEA
jgi:hypothetical protein